MAVLSPLAIAALALLAERPMHPYEMYQLLIDRQEDRLLKVRPGTLYHTVNRLAEDELVMVVGTDRAGNRPERTTYQVTAAGRERLACQLADMLAVPAEEYPQFPLAIAEAHNLPKDEVIALLRQRLAVLTAEVQVMADTLAGGKVAAIPRRYWIDATFIQRMKAAEVSWLRNLLDELQSGTLPWRDDPGPADNHHSPSSRHQNHRDSQRQQGHHD